MEFANYARVASMQKLEFANCELHVHTSIKGIMESESSLLATNYDVDVQMRAIEMKEAPAVHLKIAYHYYEKENFVCVNNSTLKMRILRE